MMDWVEFWIKVAMFGVVTALIVGVIGAIASWISNRRK